jgi:hypothetical protein
MSQDHKHPFIYYPKGNKLRNFLKLIHHLVLHVISHKIIKRKLNTWLPCDFTWLSHKLICENQCTMTKLNYEILLISKSLNNYIDYCLTTSSYITTCPTSKNAWKKLLFKGIEWNAKGTCIHKFPSKLKKKLLHMFYLC